MACRGEAPVAPSAVAPAPSVEVPPTAVVIPPGSFTMGSPQDDPGREDDEGPTHRVTLTRGFVMDRTEVTRAEFEAFVSASGHVTDVETAGWGQVENGHTRQDGVSWRSPPTPHGDVFGPTHPVVLVSWRDAVAFADWRSARDGLAPCREPACDGWRLPTEAEWEWAARAGSTESHPGGGVEARNCAGDPVLARRAWFCGTSEGAPHPVGGLAPNAWGLHDMQGNVWEWTADWYGGYGRKPATDPRGSDDEEDKTSRGGGWGSRVEDCRVTMRTADPPDVGYDNTGFRLVRSIQ